MPCLVENINGLLSGSATVGACIRKIRYHVKDEVCLTVHLYLSVIPVGCGASRDRPAVSCPVRYSGTREQGVAVLSTVSVIGQGALKFAFLSEVRIV